MNDKPQIKMMAYNPKTRKTEEVFPESEVIGNEVFPVFWTPGYKKDHPGRYVTIPGTTAADVYDEWLEAIKES